jgi:hypothetical protein
MGGPMTRVRQRFERARDKVDGGLSTQVRGPAAERLNFELPGTTGLRSGALLIGVVCITVALAVPFFGWAGVQTEGPALGLASAVVIVLGRHRRWTAGLAGLLGGIAAVAIIVRLVTPPTNSSRVLQVILRAALSRSSLYLALGGVVLIIAVAVSQLRAPRALPVGFLRLPEINRVAVRHVAVAVGVSRVLVWLVAALAAALLGVHADVSHNLLDRPFGSFGNTLVAPATAWDASPYLAIAQHGYAGGLYFDAFFPAYPWLIRLFAWSPRASVLSGIVISLSAFMVGLYFVHRLIERDFGPRIAQLTVLLVAFCPMSFFFSAVYSESLFLACSVGAIYAARRGRWFWAGLAGALATASRSNGLLIVVPLALMYLYGPRPGPRGRATGLAPRYPLQRDAAWLLLAPLPLILYLCYMGSHGSWLAPLHAERVFWGRTFTPIAGLWKGTSSAIASIHQLAVGDSHTVIATAAGGELSVPSRQATANLIDAASLALVLICLIGAVRRLPVAYWAYALVSVVVALSATEPVEPLQSFPRYMVVVFPLQLWLAIWAARSRWRTPVLLGVGAALMCLFASEFARGLWVA